MMHPSLLQMNYVPQYLLHVAIVIIYILHYHHCQVYSFSAISKNNQKNTVNNFHDVKQIKKVSPEEFDIHQHYFHKHPSSNSLQNNTTRQYETPVLIENILSPKQCEQVCDSIVYNLGEMSVDLQRKTKSTKIYNYSLNEALSLMMESKRNDSLFCFCEGLLDSQLDEVANSEMDQVKQFLIDSREWVFDSADRSKDLFHYFPDTIKPSDCLILAGEGATSTLHRDPFCWTGTSLCLEGTKVWRFIAPPNVQNDCIGEDSGVKCVDTLLDSYRLPSVAWDTNDKDTSEDTSEDPIYLSSGWQSDYSLYSSFNNANYPSAEELASMDEDEKIALIENLSQDVDQFSPNCAQSYSDSSQVSIWTVVQKPGDLLIIPAFWWHQTYAFEPSLAIASQRCGKERDTRRVFGHILDTLSGQGIQVPPKTLKMFTNENHISETCEDFLVQNFFNSIKSHNFAS